LLVVLASAGSAWSQESLLPTHISGSGEVIVTGEVRFIAGQGSLTNPAFDIDFDDTRFFGLLRAGVGLGGSFELEAMLPYEFTGQGEADESGVEFETETAGMGDLTFDLNYLITPASKTSPQVMAGLVVVVPSGNDDFATPEIRINGTVVQDGEEGGLGEGVFKVGLQFGVSKQVATTHLYGVARFLVPTSTQDEDDVEIDRPDVFSIQVGALLGLGGTADLDLRLTFNYVGDEIEEDETGGESTEEAHINLVLEPRFYFSVGDTISIILGGTVGWEEDHAVIEEAELDLEDTFVYGVTLGLHLRLGLPGGDR
jgi:hypothetical protein